MESELDQQYVNQLVANHLFASHAIHHVYNEKTGERETMDTLLAGVNSIDWTQALENEWDRLANGKLNKVKGSDTIIFIKPSQVPTGRKVT